MSRKVWTVLRSQKREHPLRQEQLQRSLHASVTPVRVMTCLLQKSRQQAVVLNGHGARAPFTAKELSIIVHVYGGSSTVEETHDDLHSVLAHFQLVPHHQTETCQTRPAWVV